MARWIVCLVSTLVLPSACSKEKPPPPPPLAEQIAKIDAACVKGDQETARKVMLETRSQDKEFAKLFRQAGGDLDPKRLNPCGVVLVVIKKELSKKK